MKTYSEKLKDPRWQKKRLEIFERDGFACRKCRATDKTLHVHHICYLPKLEPWDYSPHILITFCDGCHKDEEKRKDFWDRNVAHYLRQCGCTNEAMKRLCSIIQEIRKNVGADQAFTVAEHALERTISELKSGRVKP